MGTNSITGDSIRVGSDSKAYDDNYDRIFKKGKYAVEAKTVQPEPQAVGVDSKHGSLSRHSNGDDREIHCVCAGDYRSSCSCHPYP